MLGVNEPGAATGADDAGFAGGLEQDGGALVDADAADVEAGGRQRFAIGLVEAGEEDEQTAETPMGTPRVMESLSADRTGEFVQKLM